MLFADFSALLLLAGSVAATPRRSWKGKWQHFHPHHSFASLEDVSAGVTMPFGTGTAPVIPQSAAPVVASGTVSPIESGGDGEARSGKDEESGGDGEASNPQETPGLPSSSAPPKAAPPVAATSASQPAPPVAGTSASSPAASTPASSSSGGTSGGVTYTSTFTEYGSTDGQSGNCNVGTVSCGWYVYPGYLAAVSQNLFGAASGIGSACGSCWKLDPISNPNAADKTAPVSGLNSIVVMVNNLCPISGNEADCGQQTLEDVNTSGAHVNFDLCIDDGAPHTLFGTSGIKMAMGTATEVDCATEWVGGGTNYTSRSDTSPSTPDAAA